MRRGAALAMVAACGLSACGSSGYTKAVENNFVMNCEQGKPTREDLCRCTFAHTKKKLPFSDFQKLNAALANHKSPDLRISIAFDQAVQECAGD